MKFSSRFPGEPISKPDLYVLAKVIKTLKEQGRTNKTALATATGLSYDRLVKYLGLAVGQRISSV